MGAIRDGIDFIVLMAILLFLTIVAILFALPREAAEIRKERRMNARKT